MITWIPRGVLNLSHPLLNLSQRNDLAFLDAFSNGEVLVLKVPVAVSHDVFHCPISRVPIITYHWSRALDVFSPGPVFAKKQQ